MAKKNIDEKLRENDLNGFGLSQENFSSSDKLKLLNLSDSFVYLKCYENIEIGKIVCIHDGFVKLYDNTNSIFDDSIIGVSANSAVPNELVKIIFSGIVDLFTGLTINFNYYASANGGITDVAPISGMLRSVGFAIDADSLVLNFNTKILQP